MIGSLTSVCKIYDYTYNMIDYNKCEQKNTVIRLDKKYSHITSWLLVNNVGVDLINYISIYAGNELISHMSGKCIHILDILNCSPTYKIESKYMKILIIMNLK